jgi:hypothetical protein
MRHGDGKTYGEPPADDPELGMVHADLDAFAAFEEAVCSECGECAGCDGACLEGLWDAHKPCSCVIA